jgi:sigma-B regulation protein RsbU (phosphoserine phosphatase)
MKRSAQLTLISQVPMFSAIPRADLEHLANSMRPCEFSTGTLLIREGERDEHFFILLDGEVEVIKALGTPDERLMAIRPPGTLFGEMSLFDPQGRHTASVRARTLVQALEMTRQDFDALLHRRPTLAYGMVRQMSLRLEESENSTILDLREKNRQLTLAYQELKAAQEQIVIKEKLEKELAIARDIQNSILPENLPRLAGFDIAALSMPARAVGGDYYDFIALKGDRFGLVVGDACDKGIPAALFITLTNALVHVEAPRNHTPEATLHLVNRHLLEMNRSGMFVTMLYGILDSSGRFDYCRAGHPHPLVFDSALQRVETGAGTGMALGILNEIALDARVVTIQPGGLMLVFSDGLTETPDAGGCEFGVDRLAALPPEIGHLPAAQICSRVWEAVQAFGSGQPQFDDFTLIVIRRAK